MQITSKFTIAIHILASIELFEDKPTSELLASSIGTNPVIVRTIIKDLRDSGILITQRGSGGAKLARELKDISFYDVYKAIDSIKNEKLFKFHDEPNLSCEVGRNIQEAIDGYLSEAQNAMEFVLKSVSIDDAVKNINRLIENEKFNNENN